MNAKHLSETNEKIGEWHMLYLNSFMLSPGIERNPNAYPYRVFNNKAGEVLVFDKITVLYGNNGSGKSTLLNLIANKLRIKGNEQLSGHKYYMRYIEECSFSLADALYDNEQLLPSESLYMKSEDILYEIKKIQQEAVLREGYLYEHAKLGYTKEQLAQLKQSEKMGKQIEIMKFANEKYSNGETSMQLFDQYLVPNALYLLDEPETSLSPANQIKLCEEMNQLARYFNCQFIIATHSPFMLGTLNAKIYNMDSPSLKTSQWYELENVRFFYEFFQQHNQMFK